MKVTWFDCFAVYTNGLLCIPMVRGLAGQLKNQAFAWQVHAYFYKLLSCISCKAQHNYMYITYGEQYSIKDAFITQMMGSIQATTVVAIEMESWKVEG